LPTTLLLKNADVIATMDAARRELKSGWVHISDGMIVAIGEGEAPAVRVNEVVDLAGRLVCPGLINTHHHMFQSLTRAVPTAQDSSLFGWLQTLYPIWSRLTPEMIKVSTQTAMAELLLGGCTTSSDHLYLFPNGARLDDCIEAASEIGMRFHAARGAMSIGESQGGLPPDSLVEKEPAILNDTQRVIETYNDPSDGAMVRVVVAPCSPFSVSQGLMADSAQLARQYGVSMHTHLAEDKDDVAYSLAKFGRTPARYAEALGWLGPDVWHAHCVRLDRDGIRLFAASGTGVAHCPCSNMRLGSGIAPIGRMRRAGVPVGLGVDGSASNDSGNLIAEMRQALLLQRVKYGAGVMTGRQALEIATVGGAQVLNRTDIGRIAPGQAADLAIFDLNDLQFAGALHDPVAALAFCGPVAPLHTLVNGRFVVRDRRLTTIDLGKLIRRHNHLAKSLING
jgi:cytosine/adenosine deaminase-related metal-dependent hydrolase